jgi:hypothetical protein
MGGSRTKRVVVVHVMNSEHGKDGEEHGDMGV